MTTWMENEMPPST